MKIVGDILNTRRLSSAIGLGLLSSLLATASPTIVAAQPRGIEGVYHPLNQYTPPGVAGYWAGAAGKATPGYLQPVKIELPSEGVVTFFRGSRSQSSEKAAPAFSRMGVGFSYRIRISNMPEYPGIELYPSIEMIDRLHAPAGKADEFPIPVQFTQEEIEFALEGRLVTKVVYLEQPQVASAVDLQNPILPVRVAPHKNAFAEADRFGRPLAILRLGGRLPAINHNDSAFFGTAAPLSFPTAKPPSQMNSVSRNQRASSTRTNAILPVRYQKQTSTARHREKR